MAAAACAGAACPGGRPLLRRGVATFLAFTRRVPARQQHLPYPNTFHPTFLLRFCSGATCSGFCGSCACRARTCLLLRTRLLYDDLPYTMI